jgi:CRP-like cAMP-binding protein
MTDFKDWYRHAFGKHSPWGDEGSPALMTAAETALERQLATRIMRNGEKPEIRKVKKGRDIVVEGEIGTDLYGGEVVAEMGPGAVFGERALLEGGTRTATLTAATPCRVAVARADQLAARDLARVAEGHHREDAP